jgi:hypothetical protein
MNNIDEDYQSVQMYRVPQRQGDPNHKRPRISQIWGTHSSFLGDNLWYFVVHYKNKDNTLCDYQAWLSSTWEEVSVPH